MNTPRLRPADLSSLVGEEIGTSPWIVIDQVRINAFAHCTEDHQWIHVDIDRATRETPFKSTIAHGFLTLSMLAPTSFDILIKRVEMKQAMNYGLDKVRFLAPVRAGKRVRNQVRIASVEDKGGGRVLLSTENTIEIEGEDKPALIATALVMLLS